MFLPSPVKRLYPNQELLQQLWIWRTLRKSKICCNTFCFSYKNGGKDWHQVYRRVEKTFSLWPNLLLGSLNVLRISLLPNGQLLDPIYLSFSFVSLLFQFFLYFFALVLTGDYRMSGNTWETEMGEIWNNLKSGPIAWLNDSVSFISILYYF